MKKRVLVALSGGVDSAVAAALLLEKGYEVAGATMRLDPNSADDATRDAREVAEKLGIPFYEFDLRDRFVQEVIEPFCDRYLEGQTPNPCVLCNRTVKFGAFWEKAKALGFEFMATGHYARVTQDETGFHLLRADRSSRSKADFSAAVAASVRGQKVRIIAAFIRALATTSVPR